MRGENVEKEIYYLLFKNGLDDLRVRVEVIYYEFNYYKKFIR